MTPSRLPCRPSTRTRRSVVGQTWRPRWQRCGRLSHLSLLLLLTLRVLSTACPARAWLESCACWAASRWPGRSQQRRRCAPTRVSWSASSLCSQAHCNTAAVTNAVSNTLRAYSALVLRLARVRVLRTSFDLLLFSCSIVQASRPPLACRMLLLRRDARGSARALRRVCGGLEGHQQSCAFAAEAAAPLRSRRFVDWLRVLARAGDGGSGCARCALRAAWRCAEPVLSHAAPSFWHAPSRRKRGPDGGNGGHGGDVVLCADAGVRCLAGVSTSLGGEKGGRGGPQGRAGRRGEDCLVRVPVGTVVWQRLGERPCRGAQRAELF